MKPAGLRQQGNPFVQQKKKAGGQKLGLDLERIEPSDNHNQRDLENLDALQLLRDELEVAEEDGRYSKARKLRRQINQELEVSLYLRRSWCYGCNNVLHKCQCSTTHSPDFSALPVAQSIMDRVWEERVEARRARKALKKERRSA